MLYHLCFWYWHVWLWTIPAIYSHHHCAQVAFPHASNMNVDYIMYCIYICIYTYIYIYIIIYIYTVDGRCSGLVQLHISTIWIHIGRCKNPFFPRVMNQWQMPHLTIIFPTGIGKSRMADKLTPRDKHQAFRCSAQLAQFLGNLYHTFYISQTRNQPWRKIPSKLLLDRGRDLLWICVLGSMFNPSARI